MPLALLDENEGTVDYALAAHRGGFSLQFDFESVHFCVF
jgi:hypothetical protein